MANRTVEKAQTIVDRHAAWAAQHGVKLSARSLAEPGEAFDVFINGTAASLSGSGIPVGPQVLRPGTLALDMMYGPAAEGFLHWARQHGATPRDGLGIAIDLGSTTLVAQLVDRSSGQVLGVRTALNPQARRGAGDGNGDERIRRAIATNTEPSVTASVGVATAGSGVDGQFDGLLERADAAMYEAKRLGGDRVVAAS